MIVAAPTAEREKPARARSNGDASASAVGIELEGVTKRFLTPAADAFTALRDVSCDSGLLRRAQITDRPPLGLQRYRAHGRPPSASAVFPRRA